MNRPMIITRQKKVNMYKWIVVNGKAIEVERVTYDKGEGNRKKLFIIFMDYCLPIRKSLILKLKHCNNQNFS